MKIKKVVLILLILISSIVSYGRQIDVLKKEYNVIEKDIKEYNDYKIFRVSEFDYLLLQNLLLLKELEIFEEERRIKAQQVDIEREKKELLKREDMYKSRFEDYTKNLEISKQASQRISKFDLDETEYFVEYFANELKTVKRDLEYNEEMKKRYKYEFTEKFSVKLEDRKKLIVEAYSKLFELGKKTLEIYTVNKRSLREIDEVKDTIEVLKLNYETSIENLDYEIKERKTEFLNAKDNLKVMKKNIEVRSKRVEILKEQSKKGYTSQNDVFEEVIDLIMLNIEVLEVEGRISMLELELDF